MKTKGLKKFTVKPYSKKELRNALGINKYQFQKIVKDKNLDLGSPKDHWLSCDKVLLFVKASGIPLEIDVEICE